MKPRLLLLTEADAHVGTGHFVETLNLAAELKIKDIDSLLMVPATTSPTLLARVDTPLERLSNLSPDSLHAAVRRHVVDGTRLALTNLHEVSTEQVRSLTAVGLRVLCIDDIGDRHLDCASVITPSPVPRRQRYTSSHCEFHVYAGPQYLSMAHEFGAWNLLEREWNGGIRSIVIAMGGIDRTGTTLRIVAGLRDWPSKAVKNIVLGAGFRRGRELELLLQGAGGSWRVHRNLPTLADLFARADVGFTAGGDTMFEMACVGTPAIVIYEDDHERDQGRALAETGFSICLGSGTSFVGKDMLGALDLLERPQERNKRGQAGKRQVDGQGTSRICDIVLKELSLDPTIKT